VTDTGVELCSSNIYQNISTISKVSFTPLRCVIPVVCVTNERQESVVNQHN